MQCDDEPVRPAAWGGLVVVRRDERVHGLGELGGERGAVLGGREPHLAVDPERRQRLAGLVRAGDELADLAHEAPGDREQPARGALVGLAGRIGCDVRQGGRRDHVGRGRRLEHALGAVAFAALLDELHQPVPLQRPQVVVRLLTGQLHTLGEAAGRTGLRQLGEQPRPDRIERSLSRGGIVNDGDVVHIPIESPTTILVKQTFPVGCNKGVCPLYCILQLRGLTPFRMMRLGGLAPGSRPGEVRTCVRMAYVELHAHSAFSFLDGASLPEELAIAAVERGHTALALTDHDTVSGSMEFAQVARTFGLQAIHGCELTLEGDRHVTLLVRDDSGWRNLCRLLTRAHAHTRETPGRRTVEKPSVPLEALEEHAQGLVCLSGCARHGIRDEPTMRRLLHAFGHDAFRVELQRPFARHDRTLNRGLATLADRLHVPCVATGDVHAHSPARARLQDAFVAIREHTTLDASEPLRRGNHAHVLATPAAMAARFADHPDAVAETARLAETLEFDLTMDLGYRYPGAEDPTADRRLAELCAARVDDRYPPGHRERDEALGRIEDELRIIRALGLSGFFLLHHELLELAREVAVEVRGRSEARQVLPPGRGRGSSVSSIICYLTGLSHVDPIANRLALGRFLNEELTALPDIDLDFPRDVREMLIPRVHDRYGREHSALVAAFPTYRSRGAIREIGKALGLSGGDVERVARSADGWGNAVGEDIALALGPGREQEGRWAWLASLSREAYGLPRHLSQHSGGMIVATRPLIDCCPVLPAAMEGRQMVQWDKDSCADAGFLKIDLLGLGMLSAVERCVDLVARRRGETIDLSRIPYDDPETYRTIQEAETTGVFQI